MPKGPLALFEQVTTCLASRGFCPTNRKLLGSNVTVLDKSPETYIKTLFNNIPFLQLSSHLHIFLCKTSFPIAKRISRIFLISYPYPSTPVIPIPDSVSSVVTSSRSERKLQSITRIAELYPEKNHQSLSCLDNLKQGWR